MDQSQTSTLTADAMSVDVPMELGRRPTETANGKVTCGSAVQQAKGLLIRRAAPADREPLRALLRQHHANTVFRSQKFSDWKFDAQFEVLVRHPDNILALVAEYRGAIVGAAWAQCDHYMLSDGPPFVLVQLIAVEQQGLNPVGRTKTFLGLIAAVHQWKTEKGASHVQIHVTTGSNLAATDKLLRAAGAECVGGSYVA